MPTPPTAPSRAGVMLRTARADEDAHLIRLAALDSARPLTGPALVAVAARGRRPGRRLALRAG
jgi:hypothetical protein